VLRTVADDHLVATHVGAQHVQGRRGGHTEPLALARGVRPRAGMLPQLAAVGTDDGPRPAADPLPGEEVAQLRTGQEARLLALGALCRLHAGCGCLGAGLCLALLAQREPAALEDGGTHPGEHVRLILRCVGGAGDQGEPVAAHEAGVVARREAAGAGAACEGDERVEAEGTVAAGAGVRGLAARIAGDEGRDHGATEALAQVEGDVRHAAGMAGSSRGDDALG
jgi:hypothetical protein